MVANAGLTEEAAARAGAVPVERPWPCDCWCQMRRFIDA